MTAGSSSKPAAHCPHSLPATPAPYTAAGAQVCPGPILNLPGGGPHVSLADLGVTKGKAEHGAWAPGAGASLLTLAVAGAGLKLGNFGLGSRVWT